jgi:hypothetical protein
LYRHFPILGIKSKFVNARAASILGKLSI